MTDEPKKAERVAVANPPAPGTAWERVLERRIAEPSACPIPEEQVHSAVDFWAAQLVIADKREAFARELAAAIRTSPTPTRLNIEVDYDPDELLHAVLDSIGVRCRGWGDSAQGIFARRKVRMWIRDGYTRVTEGYGAPYRILWGSKPE